MLYGMGLRNLRYALRILRNAKGTTASAILILALAIGANTAVFTFLDRLLFQPLPVSKPNQLAIVTDWGHTIGSENELRNGSTFSYDNYTALRDGNRTFSGLAAEAELVIRERRKGQRLDQPAVATGVSGNHFGVLGVNPIVGRALMPSDDVRGGVSHVAVANYRFWNRRYNRQADAIGKTIYLNSVPLTIVGVAPNGFSGIHKGADADLYVPLGSLPDLFSFDPLSNGGFMQVFGRLSEGVSRTQAESNLSVLWGQYLTERVAAARGASPIRIAEMRKEVAGSRIELKDGSAGYAGTEGDKRSSLYLLAATVGILLLLGCANVAGLLIARGTARRREIAIQFCLGASKARILRQALFESCIISTAGGIAGIAVAFWTSQLMLVAFQWQDRPIHLSPDGRVLAFVMAISLITGILAGLAPALQMLRSENIAITQVAAAPRLLSGKLMVILEMALSLVMVSGAAMFTRSFQNLRSVPVGFSSEHVSVIRLVSQGDPDEERRAPIQEAMNLAESFRHNSNIESAGVSDFVVFNDGSSSMSATTPGVRVEHGRGTTAMHIDQGYFETLGIRMLRGRGIAASDTELAPKVAVLSEKAARRFFPGQNPVGKTMLFGDAALRARSADGTQVIGIVSDVKFSSVSAPAPDAVYFPLRQHHGDVDSGAVAIQVRSSMTTPALAAMLQSEIRAMRLPVTPESATTLDNEIMTSLRTDRLRMQASGLFGVLALLLIVAGTYGLMAYSVIRRTREIGIRMAVGSTSAGIIRLMAKESLSLAAIGVVVGLPGAMAVMKAISGMVFGLSPMDPASLVVAAALLIATCLAASVVPACRAANVGPVTALRVE